MPQNRNSAPPPEVMTWGKATPVIAVAVIFDLVRGFFQLFWFFGPALAALYCAINVSGTLATWTFGLLGTKTAAVACSAGAALIGAAGVEATAPFGVVMADAIGLIAFLSLGLWVVMTNGRILKTVSNAPLQFAGAFMVGEIPLLGAFPVFSVILWRLYGTQIKVEQAALKKYETEQAAAQLKERQQQEAQMMQYQAGQVAQAEQEATNDTEIPEEMREAV